MFLWRPSANSSRYALHEQIPCEDSENNLDLYQKTDQISENYAIPHRRNINSSAPNDSLDILDGSDKGDEDSGESVEIDLEDAFQATIKSEEPRSLTRSNRLQFPPKFSIDNDTESILTN